MTRLGMQSLRLLLLVISFASSLAFRGCAPRAPIARAGLATVSRAPLIRAAGDDERSDGGDTSDDLGDLSLGELFGRIEGLEPSAVPERLRAAIAERIRAEGPSDLEMRMNILGITPLTIAGFGLAAVILTLNAVLGGGWAANLLHLDTSDGAMTVERSDSATSRLRRVERMDITLSDEEIRGRIKRISEQMDFETGARKKQSTE